MEAGCEGAFRAQMSSTASMACHERVGREYEASCEPRRGSAQQAPSGHWQLREA